MARAGRDGKRECELTLLRLKEKKTKAKNREKMF